MKKLFITTVSILAAAVCGVGQIESFSGDMLSAALKETRITLCDFENGPLGWGIIGIERAALDAETGRSGNGLRLVKAASAGQIELKRRFTFHENFRMIVLHVFVGPGEKPPELEALFRNDHGVLQTAAMKRSDDPNEEFDELAAQIDGAWMRFALEGADVLPKPTEEPFHKWMRHIKPDPVYLEAVRIRPDPKSTEVLVDDMAAVLSDKTPAQPLYLVAEPVAKDGKLAIAARVYNVAKPGAKRKASPLRLAVEVRDVDMPLWEARAEGIVDVAEPAAEKGTAVPVAHARYETGAPLPAGGYMVYARLQEEAKDKDKTVYPTRQTERVFAAVGDGEQERVLEDFGAVGSTDNWLVETNRRSDEDTRLSRGRQSGKLSLDAAAVSEAGARGGKSLKLTSKSGRANEVLWTPMQLSAGVKKVILRYKTVKSGGGRELVMHVAGRNGDMSEHALALGNAKPDWQEAEFSLAAGDEDAPFSILGFALRGGEAEVLLDEVREVAVGESGLLQANFSADAPRVMLGVHRFADMFRTIESRHMNPIPDWWRGNEVYFEIPTAVETKVAVSAAGAKGELSYRLLGCGTNALETGTIKLDSAGKGSVGVAPAAGGLYVLEVSDGKSSRHCRLYAAPSRSEEQEMLAAQKAFAAGPWARSPDYAEPEKIAVFDSARAFAAKRRDAPTEEKKNDAELSDNAIWLIRSPLTPAVILDAPAGEMRYFADQDILGLGGPTHFAYPAAGGAKVVKGEGDEKLSGMNGSWILVWFHGAEGWDKIKRPAEISWINLIGDPNPMNIDYPHLILFAQQPESARLSGKDGLVVKLAQRTTTLVVPLYGSWKRFAEHTRDWGNGLPADVVAQCERWEKHLAYVPVDVREYYAIDVKSGDVLIKDVYDFISFRPGSKPTAADLRAPVPPAVALAADYGAPVEFEGTIEDLNAVTMMGPYRMVVGKGECNYRFKNFLRYVHEVEYAKPGEPLTEQDWQAVARRGWLGERLYREFTPMDENYYTYQRTARVIRSFPYFGEDKTDFRERARRYMYRVARDYFLEPSCFTGPGPSGENRAINLCPEGGWWGDRLKQTTGSLHPVWLCAYYGGIWQTVADRWHLARRMNSAEHTWLIPGPTGWAEDYHHAAGPGSIACARMALIVGDLKEYARNAYLAAKIWIGEAAWIQGAAPYARERQPWNQAYAKDAIPAALHPLVGYEFSGINENFASPFGGRFMDGVHENFWLWGTEELTRFWRDYLQAGTRHILDACSNRAHPGWEDLPPPTASDTIYTYTCFWSLLRMKLLVLGQPEKNRAEYLLKRWHYTLWEGPDGSTSPAHILAILRNGYEYRQVLPMPDLKPAFIREPMAFGGSGWIDGGGPWQYSPEIKGIGLWNDAFAPPKPIKNEWIAISGAIFSGFHRAWDREKEIAVAAVKCGNAEISVWAAK